MSLSIVIACCVSSKRSNTCLHLITCPSFSKQAGKRMQSAEAAASENSSLDMLVSGPGRTCNQADDNLSLCNQPQMGLLVLKAFHYEVLSLSSQIFPLVVQIFIIFLYVKNSLFSCPEQLNR